MSAALQLPKPLSSEDFDFFRARIFDLAGITLSPIKREMMQGRLKSRLAALGLATYGDYRRFLESIPPLHEEWESFTNLLTTNKTDWFREAQHFTYITDEFLPRWKKLGKKHLTVWCAASSTGEEPYTLSMILLEALRGTGITYEIQSSDIDTKVLTVASNGVYSRDRLWQIPEKFQRGAFSLGTGEIASWMKVRPVVKAPVHFRQLNLMELPYEWPMKFDLILCRNVLIYFNRETVQSVVEGLFDCGNPDCVLIIAHSESLQNTTSRWKYLSPSIYTKGKIF